MLRAVAYLVLLTICFDSSFGHGPKQHMVCQTVENIFATADEDTNAETKRGPRGPKGSRGIPGPPGTVDYDKVGEIMEEKLRSVIKPLQEKIEFLERQVAELNAATPATTGALPTATTQAITTPLAPTTTISSTTSTTAKTPRTTTLSTTRISTPVTTRTATEASTATTANVEPTHLATTSQMVSTKAASSENVTETSFTKADPVPTKLHLETEENCEIGLMALGTCFFSIVPGPSLITYAEAQALCAVEGGKLAEIVRPRQLVHIMKYLRELIPESRDYNDFWTGMTFDLKQRRINKMNGDKMAPLRSWFPGYPVMEEARSVIGIEVKREKSSPNQGTFNVSPAASLYGVLCDK